MAHSAFFVIWIAAIALHLAAAIRMWTNGLVRRFPTVVIYLLVESVRSSLLAYFFFDHSRYVAIYSYSAPVRLLAEAFAIVGIFFAIAEHYPKFRKPGTIVLTIAALIGTAASLLVHDFGVPATWSGVWQGAVLVERNVSVVMLIVIAVAMIFPPRVDGIPIRPSAMRAGMIAIADVALGLVYSWVAMRFNFKGTMIPYFVPIGISFVTAALWLACISPASDLCGEFVPLTPEELAELEASDRMAEGILHAAKSIKYIR